MIFELTIRCDNAAFDEPATEIGRILHEAAERVCAGEITDNGTGLLFDLNGNRVGAWKVK